jgi:competence protein ComEC
MSALAAGRLTGAAPGSAVAATAPAESLDARLAIGAGAAWLAVLCCVEHDALTSLVVAAAAAALGAVVLIASARRPGWWAALALALFCISLVLFPLAARLTRARASPLYALAQQRAPVGLELTVTADPTTLAATGEAGAPRVAVPTSADRVVSGAALGAVGGTVLVLADAPGWRDVLPGQRVRVAGVLQPDLSDSVLSVTLAERGDPELLGRPPWWQRAAGAVRASLRRAVAGLPDQVRGLLPGLVDGDTSNLDPVLAERFKLAGLTHLVAVSGTNCSLVVGAALLVLRRARARPWFAALVGAAVLAMFVVVARPSPSVLRAALMGAIALVSLATGRPRAALPALSAVVLALLVWDPTLSGSASFAMSALATAALLVIAPTWAAALRARRVPIGIAEAVAVAAAAHVVTAPVIAAISGRVSLVAIPANVLAEPVVAITTIVGFLAALIAPLWLPAGAALAWIAGWPCRWLVRVADFFGGLHGATIPWPGGMSGGLALLVLVAGVGAIAMRAGARRVLAAAGATSLVVLIPVRAVTSGWPPAGWVFVVCDVGQGDALVLNAGPHTAVEIDAGPDPVLIDRCLRDLGVEQIPLLVLTHFHLDHVAGLPGVVRGRSIGALLTGPLDEPEAGSIIVHQIAAAQHVQVRTPPVGTHLDIGAVHLDVLGPPSAFHGTRSDPNNSSLVLRAQVHGVRILLTGDAEIEAQQALLDSGADLRADVLKVPHHGSAYSDPDFLAAVHASVAIVSVGAANDYGQPSPVLLTEMARLGVPLLRTDLDGDVAVVAHDGQFSSVVRGVRASTVGLGPPQPPTPRPPAAQRSALPEVLLAQPLAMRGDPGEQFGLERVCVVALDRGHPRRPVARARLPDALQRRRGPLRLGVLDRREHLEQVADLQIGVWPVMLVGLDTGRDDVVDDQAELPVQVRGLAVRRGDLGKAGLQRRGHAGRQHGDDLLRRRQQQRPHVPWDGVPRAWYGGQRPMVAPAVGEPEEQVGGGEVAVRRLLDGRVTPAAGAVRQQLERRAAVRALGRSDRLGGRQVSRRQVGRWRVCRGLSHGGTIAPPCCPGPMQGWRHAAADRRPRRPARPAARSGAGRRRRGTAGRPRGAWRRRGGAAQRGRPGRDRAVRRRDRRAGAARIARAVAVRRRPTAGDPVGAGRPHRGSGRAHALSGRPRVGIGRHDRCAAARGRREGQGRARRGAQGERARAGLRQAGPHRRPQRIRPRRGAPRGWAHRAGRRRDGARRRGQRPA